MSVWSLELDQHIEMKMDYLTGSKHGCHVLTHSKGGAGQRPRIESSMTATRKPSFYEVNVLLMNFIIVILAFTVYVNEFLL